MNLLDDIPLPTGKNIAFRVKPAAERAIRRGHPWLFDGSIRKQSRRGQPGDLGIIFDSHGRFLAVGLYDPTSPIRVRILEFGKPAPINEQWLHQKVTQANLIREPINRSTTTAYRVIHGENDGLPGLVVDKYSDDFVIRLDTLAWIPFLHLITPIFRKQFNPERLILRFSRNIRGLAYSQYGLNDGRVIYGPLYDHPTSFYENGLLFEADLVQGQKTGFYLDQRENRAHLEKLISEKQLKVVLNVFAYSGGFTLYAARGGATDITSVDQSQKALKAAETNFLLNQSNHIFKRASHHIIQGDAFEILEQLASANRTFEVVILDPPSFAKAQNEIPVALKKYAHLIQLGLGVLNIGGYLVAASCSSRVSADVFVEIVKTSAEQVGRNLQIIEQTGHPIDHPITFPEGAYLKCIFAQAT